MYIYIYIYTHRYSRTTYDAHICTYIYIVCILHIQFVCMYVCVYIYIYTYIHTKSY